MFGCRSPLVCQYFGCTGLSPFTCGHRRLSVLRSSADPPSCRIFRLGPAASLEASQPSDILGTALQEAQASISQVSPDVTPHTQDPVSSVVQVVLFPLRRRFLSLLQRHSCVRLPWTLPRLRTPNDTPPLRTVGNVWSRVVLTTVPRRWSSFNATNRSRRSPSRRVPGRRPSARLVEWAGYGARQVCNRFRGKCPSCWPPSSSPNQAYLRAPALQRHASTRSYPWHTDPLVFFDLVRGPGSLEQMPQRRPRRGHRSEGFLGAD